MTAVMLDVINGNTTQLTPETAVSISVLVVLTIQMFIPTWLRQSGRGTKGIWHRHLARIVSIIICTYVGRTARYIMSK